MSGSVSGSTELIIIAVALGTLALSYKGDRTRIRKNVEARGGKVIAIRAHSLWARGMFYERPYDVSYMTSDGRSITAFCYTNWSSGVRWVTDHPPGI
jgi:hypothetical protein